MFLSVIVPTLNEEKYLPNLLKSLQNQKVDFSYEIIVADAGSSDNTLKIAKNFGAQVTLGGAPAVGRNKGAALAKGRIFLFLDADLILPEKNFLKKSLKEFYQKKLDVASFYIIPEKKIDKVFYQFYNFYSKLTQNFLPHATCGAILVKRKIHQKINGFDEEVKFAEDHFYVRKAKKFKAKFGILSQKIFTSSRRFEKDGRIPTYLKYVMAEFYMLLFGPIKKEIFNYQFAHYSKKIKSKILKKPKELIL
ncbi:glycosyltransferase [bacterium]|nr:glycosyltransferase [bacterium]